MAVSSPLLEASIDGAHGVLLSIAGGSDLGLFEINEAAALVSEAAHAEANIIFGATIDDALGDEVRVTVIAAGFDGGMPKRRDEGHGAASQPRSRRPQTPGRDPRGRPQRTVAERAPAAGSAGRRPPPRREPVAAGRPSVRSRPTAPSAAPAAQPAAPPRQVQFDDDDLDVPDFLK